MIAVATDPFALVHRDALMADKPCEPTEDPNEDGPWGKRCVIHGLPWTSSIGCEVASRRARAEAGEQREALSRERRRRAEASRAGLLELVEVGCSIYSAERKDANELALGGVIVAVEEPTWDPSTGEMVGERRWTVLDPMHHPIAVHVLAESEVKAAGVMPTPPSTLARLYFRLAEEIADAGRGKDRRLTRTIVDSRALDRHRWMGTLAKQLMGGGI